jgi:dolichol kinase
LRDRRERNRRLIHFGFGFGALLVPVLGREGALALAGAAVLYNAVFAPTLGWDKSYRRPGEGRIGGLVTYPLAVFLAILLAPLPAAMVAWAVLAVADPLAATIGTQWPEPGLAWTPRKSWSGTVAAAIGGSAATWMILSYLGRDPAVLTVVATGLGAALAESISWPMDDNIPVVAAAAGVVVLVGG